MKNHMKNFIAILMLLMTLTLAGCSSQPADTGTSTSTADLTVVCDNFAAYDWTKNVIGDVNARLILLGANGADMHSYQPSASDFAMLQDCDLCIYIGGESDSWVAEAMQQTATKAYAMPLLTVIANNMPLLTVNNENISADEHDHDHADEPELDEHIWLSLKNAVICTNAIAEKLAEIDHDNADSYRANADNYCAELTQLDSEYQAAIDTAAFDTILVADRFPFAYLVEDYRLNWFAAYAGCSAETGASFETVKFLSDTLAELKLPAVITCENADTALAQTIIKTAGLADCDIITLDSLQSVTQGDIMGGKTYIGAMTENLAALTAALNRGLLCRR